MLRRFSVLLAAALLLAGCSSCGRTDDPLLIDAPSDSEVEDLCMLLLEGPDSACVGQMHSMQQGDKVHRTNMAQMISQRRQLENKRHGNVEEIEVNRVEHTLRHPYYAEAFVELQYADGTKRTVRMPMVYSEGQWWLK